MSDTTKPALPEPVAMAKETLPVMHKSAEALEAMHADAERYRWLRDNCATWKWNPSGAYKGKVVGFSHTNTKYCDYELDAAIDAARGAECTKT